MAGMKDAAFGDRPYFGPNARPPDAPRYPDRPGFRRPGPSQEAAIKMIGTAERIRRDVLAELEANPDGLTSDELMARLGLQARPFSLRPRLSELHRQGRIVASGERRRNASGMSAHVWRLAPPDPTTATKATA